MRSAQYSVDTQINSKRKSVDTQNRPWKISPGTQMGSLPRSLPTPSLRETAPAAPIQRVETVPPSNRRPLPTPHQQLTDTRSHPIVESACLYGVMLCEPTSKSFRQPVNSYRFAPRSRMRCSCLGHSNFHDPQGCPLCSVSVWKLCPSRWQPHPIIPLALSVLLRSNSAAFRAPPSTQRWRQEISLPISTLGRVPSPGLTMRSKTG